VLLFLRRYPEQRDMVSRCFRAARSGGVSVPEVEELIQALDAAGILDEAGEKGRTRITEACRIFAAPPLVCGAAFLRDGEAVALLAGLAGMIS
jgi:hypothetical protein